MGNAIALPRSARRVENLTPIAAPWIEALASGNSMEC